MVASGMTGVRTVLDGEPPGFAALSKDAQPLRLMEEPDEWRVESAIKPYPVGYPIQAALEALHHLMDRGIAADDVETLTVHLPPDGARIVDGREMPSINVQHVLALALVDRAVDFANVHDVSRFDDVRIQSLVSKTVVVPDPDMWDPVATRQARVSVSAVDGRALSEHVRFARGTPQNPLSSIEVDAKSRDLMIPALGSTDCAAVIAELRDMATLPNIAGVAAKLRAAQFPPTQ
jgi:2-methylcitrate dehydratase PrpD